MTAAPPPLDALAGWRYPAGRSREGWCVAAVIAGLNGWLLVATFEEWLG